MAVRTPTDLATTHDTPQRRARQEAPERAPTLEELIVFDPRIGRLRDVVRGVKDDRRKSSWFCANKTWYGLFKPQVVALVGFFREGEGPEVLFTAIAYDIVTQSLWELLPDCRNCGCPLL
jgi:hypothetical protein